jgi:hypothetical protein
VYVISLENGGEDAGFAVTVGDKRVINRVLAYSDEGEWNISEVGDFEDVFWEQVDAYLAATIAKSGDDPCDNYTYEDVQESTKFVSNFRVQWGQRPSPYNDSVPACNATSNKPVGCNAVAMGQIMSYHGRPLTGSYIHQQYNRTVNAQYNWTAMKASPNAQELTTTAGKSGVANILAEAGYKLNMNYGCNGSSSSAASYMPQAFSQMGYTCSSLTAFSLGQIFHDISINRPVYIRGESSSDSAHGWIIEGSKRIDYLLVYAKDCPDGTTEETPTILSTTHYLYFNLGWNGQSNAFYNADVFSSWAYSQNIRIIHNIHPN